MNKNAYFYLTILVGVLVILLGVFVVLNTNFEGYKYSVTRENVDFVSNTDPAQIFQEVKASEIFVISPQFVQKGPENSFMLSSITLFSAVLTDKQKSIIVIGRILNEKGDLVECQSNLGDVRVNQTLDLDLCNQMLNDPANVRIFVSFPDPLLQKSKVILEQKKLTIIPATFESVSHTSFVVLDSLYDDSEAIIERVNQIVENI
ncbi:MAG TPA: hypothetical protein VFF13_02445 [archaeon]|nr:hypothetical protein [archaeon]